MISENFYEGDEISQSDEISQGDEISQSNRNYQGDEISQGDGTSQEDTSYSGDSISQKISKAPELEIANTIDKISTSIQDGAVKAYDNLPEAKTKSKWHWAQITFLFILKIIRIDLVFLVILTSPKGRIIDFSLIIESSSFNFLSSVGEINSA